MSRVPGWLGRLGAGLTEVSERLDERRAEVEREEAEVGPPPRRSARTARAEKQPARAGDQNNHADHADHIDHVIEVHPAPA
ncbi:AI-2E family transporter, partial [Streptomyces griseorubiginosus]|nr:AI-2E family transporter [Streptomyces griseorubiginosus]